MHHLGIGVELDQVVHVVGSELTQHESLGLQIDVHLVIIAVLERCSDQAMNRTDRPEANRERPRPQERGAYAMRMHGHATCRYGSTMAKTLQVRNVPDAVHRAVRDRARAAGMSVSEYLLGRVQADLERPPLDELFARAARRRSRVSLAMASEAVRAGRDARS